jgi:hypothetical protein
LAFLRAALANFDLDLGPAMLIVAFLLLRVLGADGEKNANGNRIETLKNHLGEPAG